jgi:mono/diheme cytochrome c family protein
MIEFIYQMLASIGYRHPLHPPVTHLPVGMVMGVFLFAVGAWWWRRPALAQTARHCTVLAIIGLFPTVLLGTLDWQHRYAGAWLFPIQVKLVLAGVLLVLLTIGLIAQRKAGESAARSMVLIGLLSLTTVTGLGYFGGELVYGTTKPVAEVAPASLKAGAQIFRQTCAGCHPNGENSIKPQLAPRRAPQLAEFNLFLAYLRNPKARDGSTTSMPPFPETTLNDQQARQVYDYLVQELSKNQPG